MERENIDHFVTGWYEAFKHVAASCQYPPGYRALLCEIACLAMRWIDIWKDHQRELQGTLKILLDDLLKHVKSYFKLG